MTGASVLTALRRHPSGVLLAVQLLGLFLYPLMEDTGAGRALFNTFGVLVLALVLGDDGGLGWRDQIEVSVLSHRLARLGQWFRENF